jgi:putative NADH-flavin reductase
MKLAIFGATGKTGRPLVAQALAAGHSITALARDPAKLDIVHPALRIVAGDVREPAAVAETIRGADAVLSTLGPAPDAPPGILSRGIGNIIEAMRVVGQRRLIVLSSLGIGDSSHQVPLVFRIACFVIPLLRRSMKDHQVTDQLVRSSGLDWTLIRAGGLKDGPRTGTYKSGVDAHVIAGWIHREDVADFMLKQAGDATFVRQTPWVT